MIMSELPYEFFFSKKQEQKFPEWLKEQGYNTYDKIELTDPSEYAYAFCEWFEAKYGKVIDGDLIA